MTLNEVLKNTNYDVSLFSEEARKFIEEAIVVKTVRGKETLHLDLYNPFLHIYNLELDIYNFL